MKQVKHKKFTLSLLKKNFIKLEILEEQVIEPNDVHAIAAGYKELVGDSEYVVAIYGYDFATITKEAMQIAVENYSDPKKRRLAVITNNLAHILLIRLYMMWYKPKSEIRLFKLEEAAHQWLEEVI